ncbi:hypothetical protein [Escherichia coli]|uniref:hypothetical protein n=1 Tax=Escherichia coli TaxID=562 RepID=UPI0021D351BE|nr:hypothetical protein [Escherichia coli]MCU6293974.1 hypothetical protein [Escherichia coli]
MFEQYYFNEDGEKVYFYEEHGMLFEWMKAEDINFVKKSNIAQDPISIMGEINDPRVLGFYINRSQDYISKSKTKLVVNNDGMLVIGATCTNFIRQGFNGKIFYNIINIPYYTINHISVINKKYGYDKFTYSGITSFNSTLPSRTKIEVVCNDCGDIKKPTITDLATGKIGCQECTKQTLKQTLGEFIKKSHLIHGNKYDYSLYDYINNQVTSIIICKEHGEFQQTPNSHLSGSGCPTCAVTGFKTSKPGRFYIHNDYAKNSDKAGITNKTIKARLSPQNLSYKKIYKVDNFWSNEISILFHKNVGGKLARELEIIIHTIALCGKLYNKGYYEKGDGCTETFNNIHRPKVNEAIKKFLAEHEGEYIIERDINGIFGEVIL